MHIYIIVGVAFGVAFHAGWLFSRGMTIKKYLQAIYFGVMKLIMYITGAGAVIALACSLIMCLMAPLAFGQDHFGLERNNNASTRFGAIIVLGMTSFWVLGATALLSAVLGGWFSKNVGPVDVEEVLED